MNNMSSWAAFLIEAVLFSETVIAEIVHLDDCLHAQRFSYSEKVRYSIDATSKEELPDDTGSGAFEFQGDKKIKIV